MKLYLPYVGIFLAGAGTRTHRTVADRFEIGFVLFLKLLRLIAMVDNELFLKLG